MELPDPCPADHPDIGALALATRMAPVLSGYYGRTSPLEVIVLRRLTADVVRDACLRIIKGERGQSDQNLVLASRLVAPHDPICQMACATLADDGSVLLSTRVILSDDPMLWAVAEQALTLPLPELTEDHICSLTKLLINMFSSGAKRPRLSRAKSFTKIFDNLQIMADWAFEQGCTNAMALTAFSLRLIDPDYDISEIIAELAQSQCPDGSFPAQIGEADDRQDFATGNLPTLLCTLAMHVSLHYRWHRPAPVATSDQAYRDAIKTCAETASDLLADRCPTLEQAAILGRATGRDWISKSDAIFGILCPTEAENLARICFRDPVSARHIRRLIVLPDIPAPRGILKIEADWLRGKPVMIKGALPKSLVVLWTRAAKANDTTSFMRCVRIALHFGVCDVTPQIRIAARRIAAQSLVWSKSDDLDTVMQKLMTLILLAQLFQPCHQLEAAA
ncbi:hypothetical protein [Paracoccus sp. JM45]|uniref:hypothetical protein n=1 Tax=Paracoccus sp. JM45 TaxID=2283626 RepID=UPI000E6B7240|nr:hypothetical protein [Paracoccus sp. JM45]